jgi:hypothetical protein
MEKSAELFPWYGKNGWKFSILFFPYYGKLCALAPPAAAGV